jgi:hypothetical protein
MTGGKNLFEHSQVPLVNWCQWHLRRKKFEKIAALLPIFLSQNKSKLLMREKSFENSTSTQSLREKSCKFN